MRWSEGASGVQDREDIQAANLAGFRASEDHRFEAGIPDFMNGILIFSIHFNVVHRKVDWRNPKMKSLNSMPDIAYMPHDWKCITC